MTVIHGGNVWQGGAPDQWLDFSANLNPEGPPDGCLRPWRPGWRGRGTTPTCGAAAARRGMAQHLGIPEACVLVTAGGIEAAALAAQLPGRHTVAQPTFQEYARLCGPCDSVEREKLHEHPFSRDEILWICNPNNPTGDALSRGEMLGLLRRAEAAGARLIVDEAFIEYCPEASVADFVENHPSLIVLGSLTKVLAIPGVRLGYIAADPNVTFRLLEGLTPWRLNCVADAVAAALPGHQADFEAIRQVNAPRRAAFAGRWGPWASASTLRRQFPAVRFGRDMRPEIAPCASGATRSPLRHVPGTHPRARPPVRAERGGERTIDRGIVMKKILIAVVILAVLAYAGIVSPHSARPRGGCCCRPHRNPAPGGRAAGECTRFRVASSSNLRTRPLRTCPYEAPRYPMRETLVTRRGIGNV